MRDFDTFKVASFNEEIGLFLQLLYLDFVSHQLSFQPVNSFEQGLYKVIVNMDFL